MSARDLLAKAAELRAEQRRMLDGSDTWSTRKINQVAWDLGEVEQQIREMAVNEYEALLDIETLYRDAHGDSIPQLSPNGCKVCIALARLDAVRSGT